ncbi:hypothetical protein BU17DRAFT_45419 [Hysterangium stoloniferum]|nr:hypothetical protein BU17DRAFT_45419 [Hysterangium stoloniferum]
MARSGWYILGVPKSFDNECTFVTSPFLRPAILAAIRVTIAFYTLVTLITVLVREAVVTHDAKSFFSYFTQLSYIGICAYFWASGVQTTLYARRPNSKSYPLQRWPPVLQFLHSLLWTTITTYPLIVTPVFWALLSGPSTFNSSFNAWENISVHALNSIFALFEVLLSNVGPQPWIHIPFLVLILGGYLGVAYITHATQGFYPYNFLDPNIEHARLAIYIIGIPVAATVFFLIVRLVCWVRKRCFYPAHRLPMSDVEKM